MFLDQMGPDDLQTFLQIAHRVAQADGIVEEEEAALLKQYCVEAGLVEVPELSNEGIADLTARIEDDRTKRAILIEALGVAFADGVYQDAHKETIREIRIGLGLSEEFCKECIDWMERLRRTYIEGVALINGVEP